MKNKKINSKEEKKFQGSPWPSLDPIVLWQARAIAAEKVRKISSEGPGGKGKAGYFPTFLDQVKYLCSRIPTVEWSGVLFYRRIVDSMNPDEFHAEPVYIHLMDKGSAGATSFNSDSSVIDLVEQIPELQECVTGLIHSHNSMGVFFSGTDDEELSDNFQFYDQYLSL